MSARRSYHQFCGVAKALDVIGDRWAILVVRNLLLGPRRYGELLDGLPGITTNLLAKRLAELAGAGVIEAVDGGRGYRLTEAGAALEPVVMELGRWGGRFMGRPARGDLRNIAWGLLSLKRRYRGGADLVVGIDAGGRRFELAFSPARLDVAEREAVRPDLTLAGPLAAFRRLFGFGEQAGPSSDIAIGGDAARLPELLSALGIPA
ncbi:MAG TPA: helix-turn-helix domain-containing protein [Haliangiales bacterium]|nr:helix-turn-helix domain-containing protein [Haliangiales bacterium]